ncbi:glucagon-like peptide 2 receptor isoform X2 [Myxocyprinus asiaticus]|uniref:glucagon-like peptide 2 receptor isoform X2 n=1 Tax=Myxocyprinus asiaticus TaxID=70543 RepID=UPI002222C852|nr:glucagon-like peptide 2 receptor isoform X2 [Myxocyprinus asiaticus]
MFTVLTPWTGRRLADRGILHCGLFMVVYTTQVMSSVLDELIYKRAEYQENCTRILKATIPTGTGIFCNGSFDVFACWPHSSPGIVSVPCPSYLPWIREGNSGHVYKECTMNGTWKTEENSSTEWRNQSECEHPHFFKSEEDEVFRQSVLRVLSIVGYSLSFSSLSLAVLIMSLLRATAVITKEIILQITYSNLPSDENGWNSYTNSVISVICKASKVSMEYFVGCNYFWLLVEAVFLHTLLFTAVLARTRLLKRYMIIGWGGAHSYYIHYLMNISPCFSVNYIIHIFKKYIYINLFSNLIQQHHPGTPLLFLMPWTVVKALYENEGCWSNNIRWIWWIIRGPITLSVIVIFCIFLKIIKLLLSKLKADQVKFTDYRYSLARATLVLIPLLGVHEIVFTIIIDESVEGSNRYARNFVHLTLSSFHGLLVAVLYCFANGEVQAELKKKWQVFLVKNHFEVHNCFADIHPKYLWKCSQKNPRQTTEESESNEEGNYAPTQEHALQVPVQSAEDVTCGWSTGLEFYTRKSLSSSDGEMTLGETMEEIIEESEF